MRDSLFEAILPPEDPSKDEGKGGDDVTTDNNGGTQTRDGGEKSSQIKAKRARITPPRSFPKDHVDELLSSLDQLSSLEQQGPSSMLQPPASGVGNLCGISLSVDSPARLSTQPAACSNLLSSLDEICQIGERETHKRGKDNIDSGKSSDSGCQENGRNESAICSVAGKENSCKSQAQVFNRSSSSPCVSQLVDEVKETSTGHLERRASGDSKVESAPASRPRLIHNPNRVRRPRHGHQKSVSDWWKQGPSRSACTLKVDQSQQYKDSCAKNTCEPILFVLDDDDEEDGRGRLDRIKMDKQNAEKNDVVEIRPRINIKVKSECDDLIIIADDLQSPPPSSSSFKVPKTEPQPQSASKPETLLAQSKSKECSLQSKKEGQQNLQSQSSAAPTTITQETISIVPCHQNVSDPRPSITENSSQSLPDKPSDSASSSPTTSESMTNFSASFENYIRQQVSKIVVPVTQNNGDIIPPCSDHVHQKERTVVQIHQDDAQATVKQKSSPPVVNQNENTPEPKSDKTKCEGVQGGNKEKMTLTNGDNGSTSHVNKIAPNNEGNGSMSHGRKTDNGQKIKQRKTETIDPDFFTNIAKKLDLEPEVGTQANELYKSAMSPSNGRCQQFYGDANAKTLAAACVCAASRQVGTPCTFQELANCIGRRRSFIGRIYKKLVSVLHLDTSTRYMCPEDYVRRYCHRFGLNDKDTVFALAWDEKLRTIMTRVKGKEKTSSLSPTSSAIIAVYVTANNIESTSNVFLTFSDLSALTGISKNVIGLSFARAFTVLRETPANIIVRGVDKTFNMKNNSWAHQRFKRGSVSSDQSSGADQPSEPAADSAWDSPSPERDNSWQPSKEESQPSIKREADDDELSGVNLQSSDEDEYDVMLVS